METDDREITNEVPFDMSKETLKSIRLWIDRLSQISIGVVSGQRIEPNEMIGLKSKMVKQLIVLSSPLLGEDREEIEKFYNNIKMSICNIKANGGIARNVIIYSKHSDDKLDECIQGIEKSLDKYFIPVFTKGEKY